MNVLDCFSGIGGGILGSRILGHRIVCAIEQSEYCRKILVHHQNAGHMEPFPIWDNIRNFNGKEWRGIVDMVQGGFPCQDISNAGNRHGITGQKSGLWKEMLRTVCEVRPQFVFVENVLDLIYRGLDTVLGDLSQVGYDAEWCVLGASDVGANHRRKRVWILGRDTHHKTTDSIGKEQTENADIGRSGTRNRNDKRSKANVSHTFGMWSRWNLGQAEVQRDFWHRQRQDEPDVACEHHGIPDRLAALQGLGNAQVPLCAATAWKILYQRINEK